jgi:DNA-binding XRE family transcriptional regulator
MPKALYTTSQVRDMLGLTLKQLSSEMGIHFSTLSRLENGGRCWTLEGAAAWVEAVHPKLEKLEGVDWERVPGELQDFVEMNSLVEEWSDVLAYMGRGL